jgi:hypothetical protein
MPMPLPTMIGIRCRSALLPLMQNTIPKCEDRHVRIDRSLCEDRSKTVYCVGQRTGGTGTTHHGRRSSNHTSRPTVEEEPGSRGSSNTLFRSPGGKGVKAFGSALSGATDGLGGALSHPRTRRAALGQLRRFRLVQLPRLCKSFFPL